MSHLTLILFVLVIFFFVLFRVTESLQQKDDMQSSIMNQLQA